MHCACVAADRWKDSGAAGASKKEGVRREEATELAKEGGGGVRAGALVRVFVCCRE